MGSTTHIASRGNRPLFYAGLMLALAVGCRGSDSNAPPPESIDESDILFVDVTESAGLGDFRHETGARGFKWMPETYGAGGAFIDYDGDGWIDVLLARGSIWPGDTRAGIPALQLYRNQGDGRFVDATAEAGLDACEAYGFGIAAADYDNDGDTDFLLTTLDTDLFFRNDDGRFLEAGKEVGLADYREWSTAALFFDANRDGWVDLYVGHYVPWTPETDVECTSDGVTRDYCMPHLYEGQAARFYQNAGDGRFVERTRQAGLAGNPGKTLGVAELDFNRDGWPDFVVANDTYRNLLYRNRGDGTFDEIGVVSGVAYDNDGRARAGMGVDVGVVDDSGEPTIFIGNFSEEMVGVFRHMGNDIFRDRGPASGIGRPSLMTLTFGLSLLDVELDGDLDLLLANGHIIEHVERMQDGVTYRQPVQLFINDGAGRFNLMQENPVFRERHVARGMAYADYDRDGDLDVLITENGGPAHLWQNRTNPYDREDVNVLRLALTGRESNRDAIGSSVEVIAAGVARQVRRVHTGSSYLSQSELALTFGLGESDRVDTVRITWPSGRVEVYEDVAVDRELRIAECRTPNAERRMPNDECRMPNDE